MSRRKRLRAAKPKRAMVGMSAKLPDPPAVPTNAADSQPIALRAGDIEDERLEAALLQRSDLTPEQKLSLVRARRGQGDYRHNVEQVEKACRITGLFDRRHLRARHIRPWRDSDDQQKLDGQNGLLLSPHLDHLFERGFISFSDEGQLLISMHLNPAVFQAWGLRKDLNAGEFSAAQRGYLAYHRAHVFEREPQHRGRGDPV